MAYKMALWSLTLLPGEKYPIYVRRDFTLTNAALGEDLKNPDGRSVIKVSHQPIPPSLFDDSDSEIDSDEELDDDEDDEQDEFELDEVEGFKKVNGDEEMEGEDEDEDEDEDEEDQELDSEEDSDFSDDEVEETNVLCALTGGKIEQANLNITFVEGQVITFEVSGDNAVHLLGNYIHQFAPDSDSDSDYDGSEFSDMDDEHDDYSDLYGSEEDDEELAAKITEIEEAKPKVAEKPKKPEAKPAAAPAPAQKRKAEELESPAGKPAAAEGLSKKQQKKLAKKQKTEGEGAPVEAKKEAALAQQKQQQQGKKGSRTLPSGLIIEDVTVGDGPVAKTGKRLGMRYIGKLTTGKEFDSNKAGKPFSFVLGRGEVIRGWDEGLAGMQVGGERRLTIPPQLAYGSQKIPGIPKNSTLKFDVKLVSVA